MVLAAKLDSQRDRSAWERLRTLIISGLMRQARQNLDNSRTVCVDIVRQLFGASEEMDWEIS
jgi:hypothetical protein